MSFLGCLNNRLHQMRKMAKAVALRLADRAKEEKAKEAAQAERTRNGHNIRNRSTNPASSHYPNPVRTPSNPNSTNPNNRNATGVRKLDSVGQVELPKVGAIGSSGVSNTSMKAIFDSSNSKKVGSRD